MSDAIIRDRSPEAAAVPAAATAATQGFRIFAWFIVGATGAFVLNNYLSFWRDWPGADALFVGSDDLLLGVLQLGFYALALAAAVLYVSRRPETPLRTDARAMSRMVTFLIRFAFFAVLFVGLADATVSFLRVEEMLADYVGEDVAQAWNFNAGRAPQLHLGAIGVALVFALLTRTLGFQWLTVLVVLAELAIVITRFVFSYEQAFQGDLVRFWYGALFLFASAYTLLDDGHVRVDVVYAALSSRTQGWLNAFGCLVMGILFCWVILYFGMATQSSVINAPLQSLEITQAGFGMYVKYLMAGFLGVFAVSMMIQFCSYLLDSVADYRGDPEGRPHHVHGDNVQEV
ncbi:MAG: TRAP transporter small permease subunit [Paracoccaceae bacterium]